MGLCKCMPHMCTCLQRPGIGFPEAVVTEGCKPSDMDTGNPS